MSESPNAAATLDDSDIVCAPNNGTKNQESPGSGEEYSILSAYVGDIAFLMDSSAFFIGVGRLQLDVFVTEWADRIACSGDVGHDRAFLKGVLKAITGSYLQAGQ